MNRGHLWKLLIVVFVTIWAVFEIYPPSGRDLFEVFLEKSYKRDGVFSNIVTEYKALQKTAPERT